MSSFLESLSQGVNSAFFTFSESSVNTTTHLEEYGLFAKMACCAGAALALSGSYAFCRAPRVKAAAGNFSRNIRSVAEKVYKALWYDRDKVLADIQKEPFKFPFLSKASRGDKEIALEAVKGGFPEAILYVPNNLLDDKGFLQDALEADVNVFSYLPLKLQQDRNFLLDLIEINPFIFLFISPDLQVNRSFLLNAIEKNAYVFSHFPANFKQDHSFVLDAIEKSDEIYPLLPEGLRVDRDFFSQAFERNKLVVNTARPSFAGDLKFSHFRSGLILFLTKTLSISPEFLAYIGNAFPRSEHSLEMHEFISDVTEPNPLNSIDLVSKHPKMVLAGILPTLEYGLPHIEYTNSPAQDLGGVSRDFVTKIFKSLCDPETGRKLSILKSTDDRFFPKLSLPCKEVDVCALSAVGALFAACLRGYKTTFIGSHFNPILFNMIYGLFQSLPEMEMTPNQLAEIDPAKGMSELIFKKLYTIYTKEYLHFTDEQIADTLKGEVPDGWEDFWDESSKEEIVEVIRGTFIIAQSLIAHLKNPWGYGNGIATSSSAEEFRRKIEGVISKEMVLNSLKWNKKHEATQGYLIRWIEEASDEMLQKFVETAAGSSSLGPNTELEIRLYSETERLPTFHTCSFEIDLPDGYPNYGAFQTKFEQSLEFATVGDGFQNI